MPEHEPDNYGGAAPAGLGLTAVVAIGVVSLLVGFGIGMGAGYGVGKAKYDDDDFAILIPVSPAPVPPTGAPTATPTDAPTVAPTVAPTDAPTVAPTDAPATPEPTTAGAGLLVFTKYLEGTGQNKALELTNIGTASIDVGAENLVVASFINGDMARAQRFPLSGVLAVGQSLVLVHPSSDSDMLDSIKASPAVVIEAQLVHNGNDPIGLEDAAGNLLDLLGTASMSSFLSNLILKRNEDVKPNPAGFASIADSGFEQLELDQWQNFGCFIECPTGLPAPSTAVPPPPPPAGLCGDAATLISAVQGSGSDSPMVGSVVVVEGFVTGKSKDGFFVQEETEDYDNDASTSEGIHINAPLTFPLHTLVRVMGSVIEYYGMTAMNETVSITECPTTRSVPGLVVVTDPTEFEKYEGMRIEVGYDLIITDTYTIWRYNELPLGTELVHIPSDLYAPLSTEWVQYKETMYQSKFVVEEDGSDASRDVLQFYPYLPMYQKPLRLGAKVSNIKGPLRYSYGAWRTAPEERVVIENSRPPATHIEDFDTTQGTLTVASFNVLNFFNGEFPSSRGAKSVEQFELQAAKIVNALVTMDADIVGLMEIENDGFESDSSLQTLVDMLNKRVSVPYAFVTVPGVERIGSDEITSGIIYRPQVVSPVGDGWTIDMPQQRFIIAQGSGERTVIGRMRPAVVQTFGLNSNNETLTMVVNHLKSKGGFCLEDLGGSEVDEIQGSCNALRVTAAVKLGETLADSVTGRIVLLGDLNSYSQEDPVKVLTNYDPASHPYAIMTCQKQVDLANDTSAEGTLDAEPVEQSYGFINIAKEGDFSYIYDGQVGSLDHVLVNPELLSAVKSVKHWNINSAELNEMMYANAYSDYPGYANEGPFRSSDHDPVLLRLDL